LPVLASISLVFKASAGVTTITDSATPAVRPASIVLVVGVRSPSFEVERKSFVDEKVRNLMEDLRVLLVARAEQPE
jgi:hypothetical protein